MGARNKRSEIRISVLFGFRKTIVDGTIKREIARQVYLNRANLSFYCNSCKAILIRNAEKRNAVSPKAFCTPCFFSKKRAVLLLEEFVLEGNQIDNGDGDISIGEVKDCAEEVVL